MTAIKPESEEVRAHLRQVLSSSEFSNAEMQGKALAVLVEAWLQGQELTGKELARELYGKSGQRYVDAARHLVADLRVKSREHYEKAGATELRIELSTHGYGVTIVPLQSSSVLRASSRRMISTRRRKLVWAFSGLVTVGGLGALVLFTLANPHPRSPVSVQYDELSGTVALLGKNGKVLPKWDRILQSLRESDQEGTDLDNPTVQIRAAILDSEFWPATRVAVTRCDPSRPGSGRIYLLEANGQEIDSLPLPYFPGMSHAPASLQFSDKEDFDTDFAVNSLHAVELDGDGRQDEILLTTVSVELFPTQVLALDYRGGWLVLREHWNMGQATVRLAEDLNGDGMDEILLGGTNNDFESAFITLLKPDGTVGRSPIGPRKLLFQEVSSLPEDGFFILFPKSELASNPELLMLKSNSGSIEWEEENSTLSVRVADAAKLPGKDPFRMKFSFDLERDEIRVNFVDYDAYLTEMLKLIKRGKIEDHWGILETQRLDRYGGYLASQVQYWKPDGKRWRPMTASGLAREIRLAPVVADNLGDAVSE